MRIGRIILPALVVALAVLCSLVLSKTAAHATTADAAGLPPPKKKMRDKYGHPLIGRMEVGSVARKAGVIAGVLDVAPQVGEKTTEYEWFYGELQLRLYSGGKPTTVLNAVYNFQYAHGYVSAELIPLASVTLEHPDGVPVGSIRFVMPSRFVSHEIETASEEPKSFTADFTLNGRGPYKIIFERTSDDGPAPQVLPKAKQI